MNGHCNGIANKQMVLTLPARGNFYIRARHKGLGSYGGCILPVRARAGRTCEALAPLRIICYFTMCCFSRTLSFPIIEQKEPFPNMLRGVSRSR
jgi:hypothetical protein